MRCVSPRQLQDIRQQKTETLMFSTAINFINSVICKKKYISWKRSLLLKFKMIFSFFKHRHFHLFLTVRINGFLCMTVLKTLESKKLSIETSRIILVSSIWQLPLLLSGIVFFLTFPQTTEVTEVNLTL